MRIKITKTGPTPQDMIRDIEFKQTTLRQGLIAAGRATKNYMISVINSSRKRTRDPNRGSKPSLPNYIKDEHGGSIKNRDFYVGVGNKDVLNSKVPYWFIVNYGGVPSYGGGAHFVPGYFGSEGYVYEPGSSTGRWLPSGVKGYIPPMNYIEKTQGYANRIWRMEYNRMTKATTIKLTGK